MLTLATQALRDFITSGRYELPSVSELPPELQQLYGVFVTLRREHHLRGCVGSIEASKGIGIQAAQMAIAAATEDSRFPPMERDELAQLNMEISVLSPPQKIKMTDEIIPSRHGVIIQKGKRRGLLLPQVWEESGWDRDRFLKELAVNKAGLNANFVRDPQVEWFVFEVDAFERQV